MNDPSALNTRSPCAGPLTKVKVRASPSTSVALTWPPTDESSAVSAEPSLATGASLTAVTVIETVATLLSAVPSLALKVKLSDPL